MASWTEAKSKTNDTVAPKSKKKKNEPKYSSLPRHDATSSVWIFCYRLMQQVLCGIIEKIGISAINKK